MFIFDAKPKYSNSYKNEKQEVGLSLGFCILNLLPEITSLSSIVAISLTKLRI